MSDFITAGIVPPSSRSHHTRPESQISFKTQDDRDDRIQRARERVKRQQKIDRKGAQ